MLKILLSVDLYFTGADSRVGASWGKMAEPKILRDFTCSAPVNIAIVKYWGKRDEALHLPLNGSLRQVYLNSVSGEKVIRKRE